MFWIILSLILAAVTAVVIIFIKEGVTKHIWFSLLWLLLILFGCFTSVSTGEVGIKTRFGKVVNTSLPEGINFKLPIEKIQTINVKVQKYENEKALSTSTKDMQIVDNIKITINYQVDGTKAPELYRKVGVNYLSAVVEPAIQETVKAVMSKYTAEELVTKRSEISLDINNTLDTKIKSYGINSVSTAINNFDFSEAYNEAIEKKAVAEQEVETAKNQQEKAKIEAETKAIQAEGEANANKVLEQSLTKEILEQQFIDKWDGKLPTVSGSDSILDISSFIK